VQVDNSSLDWIRNVGSLELYELLQRQEKAILLRLSTCAPTLEEVLVIKGMAQQLRTIELELTSKKKERNHSNGISK
jgi:hypothetical protein